MGGGAGTSRRGQRGGFPAALGAREAGHCGAARRLGRPGAGRGARGALEAEHGRSFPDRGGRARSLGGARALGLGRGLGARSARSAGAPSG
eukprot:3111783-Alexandrium_andersonii.AAC.1